MKRINRGPKMDGGWKVMMPGTEGGAGGRGQPLTALGGALAASDTITPPDSSCVPVVGSCRTSGDQL